MVTIDNILNMLKSADEQYHNGDQPSMSDAAYDALRAMAPTHEAVGATPTSGFVKVNHREKLLSLDNVFDEEQFAKWMQPFNGMGMSCELKLDGLALSLVYRDRQLTHALTRGDGIIGESIGVRARYIDNIPLMLPGDFPLGVYCINGEVQMLRSTLATVNQQLESVGQQPLSNTRNAAAGAIRNLDPEILQTRKLVFTPYGFSNSLVRATGFRTYCETMALIEIAFKRDMAMPIFLTNDLVGLNLYREAIIRRPNLDYDIDGVVFKLDSFAERTRLGDTTRAPRWAIAAKLPPMEAVTRIREVEYTIGRTGVITPVAILDPVVVGGVVVSKCTLHNFKEIERLKLCADSLVTVVRRGDVIPKIVQVLSEDGEPIKPPDYCPCCNHSLFQENVHLYCTNEDECVDQWVAKLNYFVSRECMDIKGIGPDICDTLIRNGFIDGTPYKLFDLSVADWRQIADLIGDKTAEKIFDSMTSKQTMRLDKFILGLCIENVGPSVAYAIANRYVTFEALFHDLHRIQTDATNGSNLHGIDGVGTVIIQDFSYGLAVNERVITAVYDNMHNRRTIDGMSIVVESMVTSGTPLLGKTYVITGTFEMPRKELKDRILALGGKVSSSVSSKTTAVLVGSNPGNKYEDAKTLGVEIIEQSDFHKLGLI